MNSVAPPPFLDDNQRPHAFAQGKDLPRPLADEKDNALSGNFGEKTEKALEQTPLKMEACNG